MEVIIHKDSQAASQAAAQVVANLVRHKPDAVLLDNMPLAMLKEAVAEVAGGVITEASGGINLDTVRAIAETGIDLISVGALTHSADVLDIGLDFK